MVRFVKLTASITILATMTSSCRGLTSVTHRRAPSLLSIHSSWKKNNHHHRVARQSQSSSTTRLTSTLIERSPSRPLLSRCIPRKAVISLQRLSRTLSKRTPQRILIGSVLALVMIFGPAFSPAARASTIAGGTTTSSSTLAATSRALGSFNFLPTKSECELCFRLLYAASTGAFIGLERSSQDRPAGVRTMALVGLGACIYTVCSIHGFLPQTALMSCNIDSNNALLSNVKVDLSRMAANIASGVGFIGAGAIHKSKLHGNGTEAQNVVAGLTTAAAVWVSAAVGVASATGLYFVSLVAALSTVGILRFAKVTKEDEPGFSWGPRPLQILEEDELREKLSQEQQQQRRPIELEELYDVDGSVEILYPNGKTVPKSPRRTDNKSREGSHEKQHGTIPSSSDNAALNAEKRHLQESSPNSHHRIVLPKKSSSSKIDIKVVNKDPLRVEQYLRKHDKRKVYDCLQQHDYDVHAVESRVQNSSNNCKP